MEKFYYGDIGEDEMQAGIKGGIEICERFHKNPRVNVTKLQSAFDYAQMIINHKADHAWYHDDDERPDQFKTVVFDAWSNVVTLQAEQKANKLSAEMVNIVDALNDKKETMTMDTFTSHVENHRHVLNELIEQDKILHNEKMLLTAVTELQQMNDIDKINIATREAESQLDNLVVGQRTVEALKEMYDVLNLCITDRESPSTIQQCGAMIDKHSDLVIKLGGLDDNSVPMEMCLVTLERVRLGIPIQNCELQLLINSVVRPQVLRNCSNPKSEELKSLIVEVQMLVNQAAGSVTTQEVVTSTTNTKHGVAKIKMAVGGHRDRLAYRQRMALQESIGIDKLVLRKAETRCGAEWAGFYVEGVKLKHVDYLGEDVDNRSACQKAYDAFDMDSDGMITIDEIIKYLLSVQTDQRPNGLQDINPFKKAKMRKLLKSLDTDNDGTLSFSEFETFWNEHN